jgi:hypothetical protein
MIPLALIAFGQGRFASSLLHLILLPCTYLRKSTPIIAKRSQFSPTDSAEDP